MKSTAVDWVRVSLVLAIIVIGTLYLAKYGWEWNRFNYWPF